MSATIVAIVGAKGGTGVSTLCAEVAKALGDHRRTPDVAVVDSDLSGRRSTAVLFDSLQQLDVEHERQGRIAAAEARGVTIYEICNSYEASFTLSVEEIERLVATLQKRNGLVVVDLSSPFSAILRPLVVETTRFVIVVEPTLLGVTAARTTVNRMANFRIPADRICLVVNEREAERRVPTAEIERTVGAPVIADIPSVADRGFTKSIAALARQLAALNPLPAFTGLLASEGGRARERRASRSDSMGGDGSAVTTHAESKLTPREALKAQIHLQLAQNIDLLDAGRAQGDAAKLAEMRAKIAQVADDVIARGGFKGDAETVARIKNEVVNEALGLGPIEDFMHDPDITEVMVNGPREIYIERHGLLEKTDRTFANEAQLRLIIERIINPLGRRLDESVPMVDARLPDGSRVNAIVQPLSLRGPVVTIRRFGTTRLTAEDLLATKSLNVQMLDFLRAAVQSRLNIVVSGGTGSGKTTLLNILSSFLPETERIVTIEDAAELHLNQPHVIPLEARPPNLEGKGQITIRDLVRNALRMRPDRIVVGECRGAEALDMLQAMNTGHDGSLTTIHANSAHDAMARIETMVMMSGLDLPLRAIREQISSAIDMVIHTARLRDGTRKVTGISEIVGMENIAITMQEIVRFTQRGIDADKRVIGDFEFTGVQPMALKRFKEFGTEYDVKELSTLASTKRPW